jgi:predicted nucleotidyltransferase
MYLLEAPKDNPYDERAKFAVFGEACRILEEASIPYVMGGGVAIRAYGRTRPLKDADIFLQREFVFPAMDALTKKGAFHTRDTDATWLFKAIKDEVLVDIIVRTTGNIHMSHQTLEHARRIELYGYQMNMMGPEDLLFRKIHSHCEGRPDQFDAFSMLEQPIKDFNWDYFLSMVYTNDVRRVLGFLLCAQSEVGQSVIPRAVVCELTERVMLDFCEPA